MYGALLTKVILHAWLEELRQGLVMMIVVSYHPFHGVRYLPTHTDNVRTMKVNCIPIFMIYVLYIHMAYIFYLFVNIYALSC